MNQRKLIPISATHLATLQALQDREISGNVALQATVDAALNSHAKLCQDIKHETSEAWKGIYAEAGVDQSHRVGLVQEGDQVFAEVLPTLDEAVALSLDGQPVEVGANAPESPESPDVPADPESPEGEPVAKLEDSTADAPKSEH